MTMISMVTLMTTRRTTLIMTMMKTMTIMTTETMTITALTTMTTITRTTAITIATSITIATIIMPWTRTTLRIRIPTRLMITAQ